MEKVKEKMIIRRGGWVIFLLPSFIFLISTAFGAWFGQDTCPSHWAVSTGYADAQRFQAPENGTSSRLEIRTYSQNEDNYDFRLAVYDDSVYSSYGHPNHKLWEGTDLDYTPNTWCGEDVTTIQLTKDAYFWFAFKTSASEEMCYEGGPTYSHEWRSGQTYSNPFPNPWGSYLGRNSNRYSMRLHYTTSNGTKGIIEIDPAIIEGGMAR